MKLKRYEGKSEAELMPIIMEEMGEGATIISVKQKPQNGFFGFFRKPSIIITAAREDDADFMNILKTPGTPDDEPEKKPPVEKKEIKPLANLEAANHVAMEESMEESMTLLLEEARKAANQMERKDIKKEKKEPTKNKKAEPPTEPAQVMDTPEETPALPPEEKKYKHSMLQQFYDSMCEQEVLPEVAAHILRDMENTEESDEIDVRNLVKTIYGSIVEMLEGSTLIDTGKNSAQTIVFMGPTGVGKTTTIAKLASLLSIKHGLRVGLITADTYRIAAVEQLKTYADILGLDIRVVYNPDEMEEHLTALRTTNDIIFIDTAGRSHKNQKTLGDMKALLDAVPNSIRYLVLSVTTRYKDMCKIVTAFDHLTDFNLIFTKLDEAETLGALMNICCLLGKKAAYVTFGQNVPDDLEAIKPDKIAKSLLGLVDGEAHPYVEGGLP